MAGLALILSRDGCPIDRQAFERLLGALDHRGWDGKDAVIQHDAALGHQHAWTTPEEIGERQPVGDDSGQLWLALDGRLDDRETLAARLDFPPATSLSDAALALAAYRRWGDDFAAHLLGSFALVVVDRERRRVVLARDALGDRSLFYALDARRLAVASEEQAILRLLGGSPRLNERSLARFFAVEAPLPGETFFPAVRELRPAHALAIGPTEERSWRHWAPPTGRKLRYADEREYAEQFRELLGASVRCRLRAPSQPAVLMSGGLDSTAIAALAANEPSRPGAGGKLPVISWVFEELPQADERLYMDAMAQACAVEPIRIQGDDGWPLSDLSTWPWNPNAPLEGLYRRLQQRASAAARAQGAAVLLSGDGADQLWSGSAHWLRDLLGEGRLLAAGREVGRQLRERNGVGSRIALRSAIGRAVGWRRGSGHPRRPWLTPYAQRWLGDDGEAPATYPVRRPEQLRSLLDPRTANAVSLETRNVSRAGIEVRRPYRDRRLVEFFLALPAHQLYRPGWTKWLLRESLRGLLPEAVRLRRWSSTLMPLATRGLVEREGASARALLARSDALWRPYVEASWLETVFPHHFLALRDGIDGVVPWRCLCAELWRDGWAAADRHSGLEPLDLP